MSDQGCDRYREQIGDYLCWGLADSETNSVDEHLAGCPGCQREFESYREVLATVDRACPASAPAGLADKVTDGVLARLSRGDPRPAFRFRPRIAAAVAACLLAGVLGVFFSGSGNADRELEEQLAAVTANAESVLWLVHELEKENEAFLDIFGHTGTPPAGVGPSDSAGLLPKTTRTSPNRHTHAPAAMKPVPTVGSVSIASFWVPGWNAL